MLKVLLTVLIVSDLVVLALLVIGAVASLRDGGGSVLFPGLGLIVSLPLVLAVVFIFELILVGLTALIYRRIKRGPERLV